MLGAVGGGRASTVALIPFSKTSHSALQKFHLCTGFPSVGLIKDGVDFSDGQC